MTHSVKMTECYATQHQIFVPVKKNQKKKTSPFQQGNEIQLACSIKYINPSNNRTNPAVVTPGGETGFIIPVCKHVLVRVALEQETGRSNSHKCRNGRYLCTGRRRRRRNMFSIA